MILLDTHVIWWLAYQPEKLSADAVRAIQSAPAGREGLSTSSACLYELAWLNQRKRLRRAVDPDVPVDSKAFFKKLLELITVHPVDAQVALAAANLSPFHSDPIDRMLVATAVAHGLTLVTADEPIRDAKVCKTIW